jgi:hypothetical protein
MLMQRIPLLLLASAALAFGQAPTIAKLYDSQLRDIENDIVPLVEAMPANTMDFAPKGPGFQGVRTFGDQAKHVASVIYLVSAAANNEKSPVDTGGENGPPNVKTKEQIVKYLKDAFAYAHTAMNKLDAAALTQMVPSPFGQGQMARGAAAAEAVSHSFDHYGQMVVYARLNNVIPPASRPPAPAPAKKK